MASTLSHMLRVPKIYCLIVNLTFKSIFIMIFRLVFNQMFRYHDLVKLTHKKLTIS